MKDVVDFNLNEKCISLFNTSNDFCKLNDFKINFDSFNDELNGYEGIIYGPDNNLMKFLFRPANDIRVARTLIILHGHGANKSYSKFHDSNWNVIIPLDEYGTDNLGSWWLGENGDFKTFHLLQNLIKILNNYFKFSSLYFWGSSMGGYGAIVHGFLLKAFAIYAHIPQIKLSDTEYTDGINLKFYSKILREVNTEFSDLTNFIKMQRINKSPVLFLSQNSMDRKKYVLEHFLPFILACDKKGFAYSVTMPLIKGHTQHISVAESVKLYFESNYRKIKNWRINCEIE